MAFFLHGLLQYVALSCSLTSRKHCILNILILMETSFHYEQYKKMRNSNLAHCFEDETTVKILTLKGKIFNRPYFSMIFLQLTLRYWTLMLMFWKTSKSNQINLLTNQRRPKYHVTTIPNLCRTVGRSENSEGEASSNVAPHDWDRFIWSAII